MPKRNLKSRVLPPPAAIPSEESPLPEYGGQTRVTLLPVDPYRVHAYWELGVVTPAEDRGVLRFHDARKEPSPGYFDVAIEMEAKSVYVDLWSPGQAYFVELGVTREGGEFVPLARSNTVRTPPAWPVAEVEPIVLAAPAPERQPAVHASLPVPLRSPSADVAVKSEDAGQEAVAEEAPGAQGPAPLPVDAAAILQQKLEKIHGFRQNVGLKKLSPPRAVVAPEAPPPSPPHLESPPLRPTQVPEARADLTRQAEEQFSPGISSKLV